MASKALALAAAALLLLSWPARGQVFTSTSATGTGQATASGSTSTSSATGGSQMQASTVVTPPTTLEQQPAAEAAAAAAPSPAVLPSRTVTLPPFSTVSLCAPVNLRITPNTTGGYAVTVQAEQPVIDGLNAVVGAAGELSITASGPFSTNQTIQLTVSLPADALTGVNHFGPTAGIYVAPGFNVSSLNLTAAASVDRFDVEAVNATRLFVKAAGGNMVVTGTLGSVNASLSGDSSIFLIGIQTSAQLTLGCDASAVVQQAPTSSITGTVCGLTSVTYTAGSCSVTSTIPTKLGQAMQFPVCTLEAVVVTPPEPIWSCGIKVEGNFTCMPGSAVLSSAPGSEMFLSGTAPSMETAPGGFVSAGASAGGAPTQAGQAAPGAAASLANAQGTAGAGSVSAASSSTPASSGSVTSQTSQKGVTQVFTTTSAGVTTLTGTCSGACEDAGDVAAWRCRASRAERQMPL